MSVITIFALLVFLTIPEGISMRDHGVILRCQCISKEKQPIARFIEQVEVIPASSHCKDIEIIATLKVNGERICLDPDAPWVKKVFRRRLAVLTP